MDEEYSKDFDKWNEYKKALEKRKPGSLFGEREIWWCALGTNVGSEQDGKNESFERPVLVLKKVNVDRLIVIPTTSKIKDSPGRMPVSLLNGESQLLLTQIRSISSKRLLRRIQSLKTVIFQEIIIRVARYFLETSEVNETPPGGGESSGS